MCGLEVVRHSSELLATSAATRDTTMYRVHHWLAREPALLCAPVVCGMLCFGSIACRACRLLQNLGVISTLAFIGTVLAAGIIALTVWLGGVVGASAHLGFFYSSLYGGPLLQQRLCASRLCADGELL